MDPPEGGTTMMDHDAELTAVFSRFYGTIWSKGALDEPTKEVVRMRSARSIGCETCRNLRFAGARDQGLDEEMLASVGDGYASTDLTARWKSALAWSDAVSGFPAHDRAYHTGGNRSCVLDPRVRRADAAGWTRTLICQGDGRMGPSAQHPSDGGTDADPGLPLRAA